MKEAATISVSKNFSWTGTEAVLYHCRNIDLELGSERRADQFHSPDPTSVELPENLLPSGHTKSIFVE